jgi:hypothetical protein
MKFRTPDIEKMSHNDWLAYRESTIEKLEKLGHKLLPNPECGTCDLHNDYVCFDCESNFIIDGKEKANANEKPTARYTAIYASEKYLSYKGDAEYAMRLVDSLHDAYQLASEKGGDEMPKMLSDFVFNIEMTLQNAGVLDEHFNLIR